MKQIQTSNYTEPDRYPAAFDLLSKLTQARKILSYGCSTGEEPHILSTKYFPEASILAVDTNAGVLAQATATYGDNPRIRFANSTAEILRAGAPFDVIFAMSTLCLWPTTQDMADISELFPFADFESQVALLTDCLRARGFLVAYNSNYSVLDTDLAPQYATIDHASLDGCGFVHRFNKLGLRAPAGARDFIHQKL